MNFDVLSIEWMIRNSKISAYEGREYWRARAMWFFQIQEMPRFRWALWKVRLVTSDRREYFEDHVFSVKLHVYELFVLDLNARPSVFCDKYVLEKKNSESGNNPIEVNTIACNKSTERIYSNSTRRIARRTKPDTAFQTSHMQVHFN